MQCDAVNAPQVMMGDGWWVDGWVREVLVIRGSRWESTGCSVRYLSVVVAAWSDNRSTGGRLPSWTLRAWHYHLALAGQEGWVQGRDPHFEWSQQQLPLPLLFLFCCDGKNPPSQLLGYLHGCLGEIFGRNSSSISKSEATGESCLYVLPIEAWSSWSTLLDVT